MLADSELRCLIRGCFEDFRGWDEGGLKVLNGRMK